RPHQVFRVDVDQDVGDDRDADRDAEEPARPPPPEQPAPKHRAINHHRDSLCNGAPGGRAIHGRVVHLDSSAAGRLRPPPWRAGRGMKRWISWSSERASAASPPPSWPRTAAAARSSSSAARSWGAARGVSVRGERRGAGQALGGRVLLACGGFAGDDALVAEHCPAVALLPFQGGARATGDGLRLGREAGAATRRLASFLVTPFLATPGQLVPSAPLVDLGAVLVNQAGRRFADETAESLPLATIVRAQPGRVAYLLFGERTAAAARAADPFFARVVLPRAWPRSTTLEDLAKQFELDAEGLRLTVETFN